MKYQYRNPTNSRFKRWLWVSGLVVLALALTGWLAINQWYKSNLRPLTDSSHEQVVLIELGASTSDIGQQLQTMKVIRDAKAFVWYINRLPGEQHIQAGTYKMDSASSVQEIADILVNGKVDTSLVTIPPGLRLDEIRQVLINAGFSAQDVDKALVKTYDHPLMQYLPAGATLEGYIYPETFQITADSTPQSIVQRAFDALYEQLTPSMLNGFKQHRLTVHEAIILASIIEKEVADPASRRMVAQVFLSRLKKGIQLGSDVTFFYAAAITGQDPSPQLDSPYNTRLYSGLPPGPIANFDASALQAVANPADTDYLYFVSGDDGQIHFSHTEAEHQANVERYCHELCQ